MRQIDKQTERLPKGYRVNSMVTGEGKTYLVETTYPHEYKIIVRGQATPKQAVDRALPIINAEGSNQ